MEEKNHYPTKDEILSNLKKPDEITKQKIIEWKKEFYYGKWKDSSKENKINAFISLIATLINNNQKIKYAINITDKWYILINTKNQETQEIGIDQNNLSIISCLHEIGHALHGKKELDACTYSIGIFIECFPKEYSDLMWKGHLLIKK